MKEIRGATTPTTNELAAQTRAQRARAKQALNADKAIATVKRASIDQTSLSARGQALSKLEALPPVRTELVNRMKAQVNSPEYDLNAKFASALDKMLDDIF